MTETENKNTGESIYGPLGEIALTLSGGGYRAAAFHLGSLSMLHELGLLQDVTRLSTISGGTITGVKYVLELRRHPQLDFGKFERDLRDFYAKTNVTAKAVSGLLKTTSSNGESLMPSLIRSAASVYANKDFVGHETFGSIRRAGFGIKEISFNATDFFSGTRFRFQFSHRPNIYTGSVSGDVPEDVSDKIRLADIIAASSCFPGGFEPIFFPADFMWPEPIENIRASLKRKFSPDVPLMDGGIFDNQGIDSLKRFLDRKDGSTNLFVISDSSPRCPKIYDRKSEQRRRWLPLWLIVVFATFLFVSAGMSILALLYDGIFLWRSGQLGIGHATVSYLLPILSALIVFGVLGLGFGLFLAKRAKAEVHIGGVNGWLRVLRLTVPEAIEFGVARICSVLAMTSNVFMSRIRSLGFTSVYSDKELNPFVLSNLIYDLDDEKLWKNKVPPQYFPKKRIRDIALDAESYDTTLNFENEEDSLDKLIACGKSTMCFNILRYLLYIRKSEADIRGTPLNLLLERVKINWVEQNQD
ncbi:MAG: patatin-like phospholipase family protein [Pyrinomonadaceae bacterium]